MVLFASSLGTIMEYFDYFAYGIAAAVAFPALFFGPLGPALAMGISLASTLLLTVGRPIGGVIFGHLGDTRGRTSSLVLALTIMGVATLAIGLLPTYAEIGVMAPVLLLTFRVIQGIGLGGEWGGALTWARETVGKSRWSGFLTGGVVQTAPGWGTLLAGAVGTLIILTTGQTFFAAPWGSWRYIFYIGAALLVICAVIRLKLLDSPLFLILKSAGRTVKSPVSVAFRRYWRSIIMFSFIIGPINFILIPQTYVLPYFASKGFPVATAALASSLGGIGIVLATLCFGLLADFLGRKRAGFIATLFTLLMVYPYWLSVTSLDPTIVIAGTFLFSFASSGCISGVFPSFFTESFPTEVRQTAAGLSLQLTTFWNFLLAIGVWTPIIAVMGSAAAFPYLLLTASMLCMISLILWALPSLKETKGKELTETPP
jgi:MFS family permease